MSERDPTPTYRLELSSDELAAVFAGLGRSMPPYVFKDEVVGPSCLEAAQRSLVARGLVRAADSGYEVAEGVAQVVDTICDCTRLVRARCWTPTDGLVAWYAPTETSTVRIETTPQGTCRLVRFDTRLLLAFVAVDVSLQADRGELQAIEVQLSESDFGGLVLAIAEGRVAGVSSVLVDHGVRSAVATAVAEGLVQASMTGNVAAVKPKVARPSAVEVGSVGWLDAGRAGIVRVSYFGGGGGGSEQPSTVVLGLTTDEHIVSEIASLLE